MIRLAHPEQQVSETAVNDPDVQLMLRVVHDDGAAFCELVHRYERRVASVLRRQVACNWQSIEDLTQEVFMRIYRARKSYMPRSRFSSWLFTIVHNVALNAKRTFARRRESFLAPTNDEFRTDPFDEVECRNLDPVEESCRQERCGTVRSAINRLNPRQREAMELNNLEGMSHAEVADQMETTPRSDQVALGARPPPSPQPARGERDLKAARSCSGAANRLE